MKNEVRIYPFNNLVETGLRILTILVAAFPESFDIQMLVYYDYLTVHTGDIDPSMKSLHAPVPNRSGEVMVRRKIIEEGIEFFIERGLVEKKYMSTGIKYLASENAAPYIDSINGRYFLELNKRANWVVERFSNFSPKELSLFMNENVRNWGSEFDYEIL